MNDLETMLREALQSAPTPAPSISDPVASVTRRANRARAFITGGALAVAAVVTAAIVVPLQLGGNDRAAQLSGRPTPAPSPTVATSAATPWPAKGASALAAGGGSLWSLRPDSTSVSGALYLDRLDPLTHANFGQYVVQAPATWLFYGLGRVWVTGGGDGAYPDGVLQVLNPANGSMRHLTSVHQQLSDVAFVAAHAWVLAGRAVWEVDTAGRHVGTVTLPVDAAQMGIVATDSGELWVQAATKSWLRIDPASRRVVETVQWSGPMLAAAGGSAIWTSTGGRLVALTPSLLHQGQSVAQGQRISFPGPVTDVARSGNGGLFVLASDGPDPESSTPTLYFLSAGQLAQGAAVDRRTPSVAAGAFLPVAPDGAGGVNYLSDQGGMHWTP